MQQEYVHGTVYILSPGHTCQTHYGQTGPTLHVVSFHTIAGDASCLFTKRNKHTPIELYAFLWAMHIQ
jgi:hypothetical protein